MKDPQKLQSKLRDLLRSTNLKVGFDLNKPLTDLQMKDVAWVVADHVNHNAEVINADPLKDWVEEYRFFLADRRV